LPNNYFFFVFFFFFFLLNSGSNVDLVTGFPDFFFFLHVILEAAAVCYVEVCSSFFPNYSSSIPVACGTACKNTPVTE